MTEQDLTGRVPNPNWFFKNHKDFPWSILSLDRPFYGPLHSYLCSLCSKYENDSKIRTYLAGRPTWRSIEKFANNPMDDDKNPFIAKIHNYCNEYYNMRESDRPGLNQAVVNFMWGIQPFQKEFAERLNVLYQQGRLNLKLEMTIPVGSK
jgi:hypothetical protein